MGKKGDLLRAQKMQRSTYTFTREQLEEHDRIVVEHAKEKIKRDLMAKMEIEYAEREAHVKKVIEEEWKSREELFKGQDVADNFFLILSLLLGHQLPGPDREISLEADPEGREVRPEKLYDEIRRLSDR